MLSEHVIQLGSRLRLQRVQAETGKELKKTKKQKSLEVFLVFLRGISIYSVIWTYIHYKYGDYFM